MRRRAGLLRRQLRWWRTLWLAPRRPVVNPKQTRRIG